jgi:hypothetical protein
MKTLSTLKASPGCASDCSIRSPIVDPDRTAVAATIGRAPSSAGGMVKVVEVSLMIVPVAPTRSRRMMRAGLPAA